MELMERESTSCLQFTLSRADVYQPYSRLQNQHPIFSEYALFC